MITMLASMHRQLANILERFFHRPTPTEITLIKNTHLFDDIDEKLFTTMVKRIYLIHYAKDQLIFKEGDEGDALYIISSGSVRVFTINVASHQSITLANLGIGDYFGEQALIKEANKTRNADIETTSPTTLIKINKESIEAILLANDALKSRLNQRGRAQAIALLSKLSQFAEIEHILTHVNAKLAEFERGQTIFAQGDVAENVYIILNGKIELLLPRGDKQPRHSTTLYKGNVFGEVGVITQQPRSGSAIALEDSSLLVIDGREFKQYLAEHPTVKLMLTALQHTYELPKQGIVEQYIIQDDQMGSAIVNMYKLESGISVTAITAIAQSNFHMKVDNVKAEKHYHYHHQMDIHIACIHRQIVAIEVCGHWEDLEEACHALLTQQEIDEKHFQEFQRSGKLHLQHGPITNHELDIICACMSVSRANLQQYIDLGVVDFNRLCQKTGACTVCQSCKTKVLEMIGHSAWLPANMRNLRSECDDIISYQIKPISYHFNPFIPGQHVIIQTRLNDHWVERPYYISGVLDDGSLQVTIQKIPQGSLSEFLFSHQHTSLNINVSQPRGEFHLMAMTESDVLCLVEGIGISAFIPYMQTLKAQQHHLQLHYFVPSAQQMLFATTLSKLSSSSFISIITHSYPDNMLTPSQLQTCLQALITPTVYICGSATFTQHCLSMLQALSYPSHKIHHEAFTNAAVPLSTNQFTYTG